MTGRRGAGRLLGDPSGGARAAAATDRRGGGRRGGWARGARPVLEGLLSSTLGDRELARRRRGEGRQQGHGEDWRRWPVLKGLLLVALGLQGAQGRGGESA